MLIMLNKMKDENGKLNVFGISTIIYAIHVVVTVIANVILVKKINDIPVDPDESFEEFADRTDKFLRKYEKWNWIINGSFVGSSLIYTVISTVFFYKKK